jgi:hypothetical protein
MPVDNSIALQAQQPNLMTPFQAQQGALTIQDLMQQNQIRAQQIKQTQMTMRDQAELSKAWSNQQNIDPKTGLLDPEKVKPTDFSNPAMYQKLVENHTTASYKQSQAELEKQKSLVDTAKEQQSQKMEVLKDAHDTYAQAIANGIPKDQAENLFQQKLRENLKEKQKVGLLPNDLQPPPTNGELAGRNLFSAEQQAQQQENKIKEAQTAKSEADRLKIEQANLGIAQHRESRESAAAEGIDHSKLTPEGQAAYDEMTMAGLQPPRSKRGQIDYEELNNIGKKEAGGAGSGNIVSGRQDNRTNQATLTDFTKGKPAQSLQSINAVVEHLGTYRALAKALDNGDIQLYNKYKNDFEKATGKTLPNDIQAAAPIIGDEIVKAIIPGGGSMAEREDAKTQWNSAISNKQVGSQIDNVYLPLMQGQVEGLRKRYETTGRTDFEDKYLTKTTRDALGKLSNKNAPSKEEHNQAMDWAKAHPDDPRAKKIMELNGG